jgi:uncharacterized repeat protein (TIGR01451 family)
LYGILFNDASGTVNNVTVEHIFQGQTSSPSCQTGTAIRAEGPTAGRTVTITNTKVLDYQKNGIDGRGSMTMNVSGNSIIGPPHPLAGLIAQNGLVYVNGAGGTAMNNTIFGSGDQKPPGPPGGGTDGTAVLLFGANNVTIDHNIITSDPSTAGTDVGVSVLNDSTGITVSFNQIGRTAADVPDPTGHGVDVFTPDGSTATLICNTFTMWNINVVGAEQIACAPLPAGTVCVAYSAPAPAVDSGQNYDQAEPNPIIPATPFTWTVDSGTLPPGLSLSSAGAITGTPTAAGTFNFTVKLVDATGLTATQPQAITIAAGSCPAPAISVAKSASPTTVTAAGEMVTYTFHVTNKGNVTLTGVKVTDPLPGLSTITCPSTTLAPAASMSCTATYTTTQTDLNRGSIKNTATASGTDPSGGSVPSPPSSANVTVTLPTAPVAPITPTPVAVTG